MTRHALRNKLCAYNCANMFNKMIFALGVVASLLSITSSTVFSKSEAKPLDPNDPRLTFSFPIHSGGKPFHFKVKLDKAGSIAGVSIYRNGQTRVLQTLPSCREFSDQVDQNWGWGDLSVLIAHADVNFDGYQDLELVQNYIPHLDKKLYCVFLWDENVGRFRYSKDVTDIAVDLEAHPENKTLTTRQDWMGGAWKERTYHWKNGKLELIEEESFLGYWSDPPGEKCGFKFTCSQLIHTEMTVTFDKDICTPEEMDNLPPCPAPVTSTVPKEFTAQPAARKKH